MQVEACLASVLGFPYILRVGADIAEEKIHKVLCVTGHSVPNVECFSSSVTVEGGSLHKVVFADNTA